MLLVKLDENVKILLNIEYFKKQHFVYCQKPKCLFNNKHKSI